MSGSALDDRNDLLERMLDMLGIYEMVTVCNGYLSDDVATC